MAAFWIASDRKQKRRRLMVVVGDGRLSTGRDDVFAPARRNGIEVSVLNVANRKAVSELRAGAESTGGVVVDARAEAAEAERGRNPTRLLDRLAALFAPVAKRRVALAKGKQRLGMGPLRAGEELVWETVSAVDFGTVDHLAGPARGESLLDRALDKALHLLNSFDKLSAELRESLPRPYPSSLPPCRDDGSRLRDLGRRGNRPSAAERITRSGTLGGADLDRSRAVPGRAMGKGRDRAPDRPPDRHRARRDDYHRPREPTGY